MELVYPAMNDGNVASTQFTAASIAGSRRIFTPTGTGLKSQHLRFEIKAARHE